MQKFLQLDILFCCKVMGQDHLFRTATYCASFTCPMQLQKEEQWSCSTSSFGQGLHDVSHWQLMKPVHCVSCRT